MPNDPLRNFRFVLEIDGIQQAGFNEVGGFETSTDAIEYREGNEPTHVRKICGLTKYANITLEWGMTDSMELAEWSHRIASGTIDRRSVAINLVDEEAVVKARFEIEGAWPCKYGPMTLNAEGNEILIETLELCIERFKRVL